MKKGDYIAKMHQNCSEGDLSFSVKKVTELFYADIVLKEEFGRRLEELERTHRQTKKEKGITAS